MARKCSKCGYTVIDGAKFCPQCGSPIASVTAEKKKGFSPVPLIMVLIAALLITGFWVPGFLRKPKKPKEDTDLVQTEPRETSKPQKTNDSIEQKEEMEWPYHSDPVDFIPFDGVHVIAPENVLYEDTVLSFTPYTELTDRLSELNEVLEADGKYMVNAWEVDAGLEEGQVLPGEYTVEIDLDTLGIPEELYDQVRIVRVDDYDNGITELLSKRNRNVLSYSSDNNCIVSVIVWTATGVGATIVLRNIYLREMNDKTGFYGDETPCSVNLENQWGKFSVLWSTSHMDPDQQDKLEQLALLEQKIEQEAKEDYERDEIIANDTWGSLYWLYHRNLSVAERILEMKKDNKEYQTLLQKIRVPDSVQEVIDRINLAYEYLAEEELVKMPKFRLEFLIKKGSSPSELGAKSQTKLINTYIDLMVISPEIMTDSPLKQKNTGITFCSPSPMSFFMSVRTGIISAFLPTAPGLMR